MQKQTNKKTQHTDVLWWLCICNMPKSNKDFKQFIGAEWETSKQITATKHIVYYMHLNSAVRQLSRAGTAQNIKRQ